MTSRAGVRFIDLSAESPAVQAAVDRMIREMKAERTDDDAMPVAATLPTAAEVDDVVAGRSETSPRLTG